MLFPACPRNPIDNYEEFVYFFDDFFSYQTNIWTATVSGTTCVTTTGTGGQIQVYGVVTSGTWERSTITQQMCSAAQDAYIAWRVKLSSATDIAALAGLYDSALTSYIALSVDTAASSNFRFVANSGGSTTFVDTSIALDTNWHRAVMVVSTGAVSLFFDGVKQTAITTNITANQLAPGIGIKTITNRRYIYADWCECYCRRVAS